MSDWRKRRTQLDQAIGELSRGSDDQHIRLHLELLRVEDGLERRQDLPGPQKRLRSAAFTPDDFPSLSVLSSTSSFNRVELVRPSNALQESFASPARVYVLKTVDRRWAFRMREQQSLRHELAILRLGTADRTSSRLPRLVASFLSPASFHLLVDHSAGGDIWSVLERKNEGAEPGFDAGLPEEWVKLWMAETLDAVEWLHEKGWVHRDIKPQNLLLQEDGHLLLTDFGAAAPLINGTASLARKYCRALTGTPDYIAPEVLRHAEKVCEENEDEEDEFEERAKVPIDENERAYGAEVDTWGCGIVLYELLVGRTPFFAEDISETYERIVRWREHLTFPTSALTKAAKEFIQLLLVAAEDRPSISKVKSLPWFSGTDWSKLRTSPAPYLPPPFHAPPSSPSFNRSQHSFANDLDPSSFFSSPGLSILRPSPRTADSARREEREYWEAREFGGLTTLPATDEFDRPAAPSSSQPLWQTARSKMSGDVERSASWAFETPARPTSRPSRLAAAGSGPMSSTPIHMAGTPASSGRSRRMISEMDAWKEMQEHAWSVGMSARKLRRASGIAAKASPASRSDRTELPKEKEEEKVGEKLGGLEQRQREMVERLEEMDRKYQDLFKLAAREGEGN